MTAAFDPFSPPRVRQVAAVARRTHLAGHDPADVRQELALRLVADAARFDPARGSAGQFAATVLRTARARLIRTAAARKRGAGVRTGPLGRGHEPVARTGGGELAVAVGEVLGRLPADLKRLAEHLRGGGSLADLARDGGGHRATLHRRLGRLRDLFTAAGFAPTTAPEGRR